MTKMITPKSLLVGGISGIGLGAVTLISTSMAVLAPAAPFVAAAGMMAAGLLGGIIAVTREKTNKETVVVAPIHEQSLPDKLREQLEALQQTAQMHFRKETKLAPKLNSIIELSQELFKRVEAKSGSQAHKLAAVNYTDTLMKLNKAVSEDYYLDILIHPQLWDRPEMRLKAVEKAVIATSNQLLTNIKRVNASHDVDYAVVLNSLSKGFMEDEEVISGITGKKDNLTTS